MKARAFEEKGAEPTVWEPVALEQAVVEAEP